MDLQAYRDGAEYYLCRPGGREGVRWRLQAEDWTASSARVPAEATPVELAALPPELREEVLAFAVRAAAMGESLWSADGLRPSRSSCASRRC